MGRWGHRLFEGDHDLDISNEIEHEIGGRDTLNICDMINQTDMLASQEYKAICQTDEYAPRLEEILTECRTKFDSGMGNMLFDKYRSRESEWDGEYTVIIVGALMMRAGAKIRTEDLQHLRDLADQVECNAGLAFSFAELAFPFADCGFRGPGKAQFLAALDKYKPGVPRSFQEPSCFHCGLTKVDTNKEQNLCGKCKGAWYCDRNCQRAHWSAHKGACIEPGKRLMVNV